MDGNAKDIMYHSDEDIIYNLDKKSLLVLSCFCFFLWYNIHIVKDNLHANLQMMNNRRLLQ